MKKRISYKEKGITLVALVITIIILLILTGVTISSALGENGLFKIAKKSAEEYKNSEIKESEELDEFAEEFDNIEELGGILINDEEELIKFREEVNSGNSYEGKTIYLKNDIELKEENWVPIGTEEHPFTGTFDGRNKKITNLNGTYSDISKKNVGFFGNVNNATIRNVNVEGNIIISSAIDSAGGIVGKANEKISIDGCNNNVKITSENATVWIGGIIGRVGNNAQIKVNNSINSVELSGKYYLGGCYGSGVDNGNRNIEINNFVNYGNLFSEGPVGGCVGETDYYRGQSVVKIINTRNICKQVKSKGQVAGGLVGYGGEFDTLVVSNSYNTSEVISEGREAGGIIGDTDAKTYCINIYNEGDVEASANNTSTTNGSAGGIIGSSVVDSAEINVINTYNTGKIVAKNYGCGILGVRTRVIDNSYMKNVYNLGILESTSSKIFGLLAKAQDVANIKFSEVSNAFFANAESGSNMESNIGTKKEENDIKTEGFVNTLNEFVTEHQTIQIDGVGTINLSSWKLGEKGYPILKDIK